jgi:hypothetical protein
MWGFAELDRKHVWLVCLPIAAFALAELLVGTLAPRPDAARLIEALKAAPGDLTSTWRESAARMQFLTLLLLFFVTSLVLTVKVLADLRAFSARSRRLLLLIFMLCVAGGGALLIPAKSGLLPSSMDILGTRIFLPTANEPAFSRTFTATFFEDIITLCNIVSLAATASLVTAGISCLGRVERLAPADNWKQQVARLKTYIYLSAGLLVIGVLYMKTWASYPVFLLPDAEGKAYSEFINAFTTYNGIEYSILLAAFAVPVSLILSRRAESIARDVLRSQEPSARTGIPELSRVQEIREAENLTISTREMLTSVAALLAPFLTGAVSGLASVVT